MTPGEKADLLSKARERVQDFRRFREAGLCHKDGEYFPSVHYPPITMYPPMTQEELFATYTLPPDGYLDVYVHIPFCHRRCIFCHYPGKFGQRTAEKDQYLDALEKEMDITMGVLGVDKIKTRSVLMGGGTPSYLTPKQLKRFLDFFSARMDQSNCQQFNWDVDPSTLVGPEGLERLRIIKDYGGDRLTIGVQSLDETILKKMNRSHGLDVALESIDNCNEFGFKINIEFIFGYPGQTLDNWIDVMEHAVSLDVGEIQLYRLKVEAYGDYQGPIKRYRQIHPEEIPSHDEGIMMKQLAIDICNRHGYFETLRRVFGKERKTFSLYAHNQCCMLYDEIGFGLTAFSSLRDRFILNTQSFDEYYRAIEQGRIPMNRGFVRSAEEQARWAIILPIKNRFVRKGYYEKVAGFSLDDVFRRKFEKLRDFGLIDEDDRKIGVTRLGAFFADEVAQQFQHPDYMPFPRHGYNDGPLNPFDDCDMFAG